MQNMIQQLVSAFSSTGTAQQAKGDYAIVPDGYNLKDLESYQETPRLIAQHVNALASESFTNYINRFISDGTTVFANIDKRHFKCILDFAEHGNDPKWNKHTITYSCPESTAWKVWIRVDGTKMNQVDFARFIEDNLPDIVKPSGSDMLTISKELQAKKQVDFKSGQNLANGDVQFTYNETTNASAGQIDIPQEFTLGIPVFVGGPLYEVTARLRYRITEGNLAMWFDLLRPERMLEDAFAEMAIAVEKNLAEGIELFHAEI